MMDPEHRVSMKCDEYRDVANLKQKEAFLGYLSPITKIY